MQHNVLCVRETFYIYETLIGSTSRRPSQVRQGKKELSAVQRRRAGERWIEMIEMGQCSETINGRGNGGWWQVQGESRAAEGFTSARPQAHAHIRCGLFRGLCQVLRYPSSCCVGLHEMKAAG